jgi:archaellum component FlaC
MANDILLAIMDTSKFATKSDILNLKAEIRELRVETKTYNKELDTKLDRLQNTLDGFVGRVDDLSVENEIGTHQTREIQLQVNDLEKRVKHIESSKTAV